MNNTVLKLPEKNRKVKWIKSSGKTVLLDPGNGRYYNLNFVASAIWDMCDGTNDAESIVAEICGLFDGCSRAGVRKDVRGVLRVMQNNGLIVYGRKRYL